MKPVVDLHTQLATIEADVKLNTLDLPRITAQQRVYVAGRVSGLSMTAAAKQAGTSLITARKWEDDDTIQAYMDKYLEEMQEHSLPRVRFGIEDAHGMYMKAYHMSATAAEMVKATDSLVKLHKLNEPVQKEITDSVTARELVDMPLSELMRLAGMKIESLQPGAIDGEYEEISQ